MQNLKNNNKELPHILAGVLGIFIMIPTAIAIFQALKHNLGSI